LGVNLFFVGNLPSSAAAAATAAADIIYVGLIMNIKICIFN